MHIIIWHIFRKKELDMYPTHVHDADLRKQTSTWHESPNVASRTANVEVRVSNVVTRTAYVVLRTRAVAIAMLYRETSAVRQILIRCAGQIMPCTRNLCRAPDTNATRRTKHMQSAELQRRAPCKYSERNVAALLQKWENKPSARFRHFSVTRSITKIDGADLSAPCPWTSDFVSISLQRKPLIDLTATPIPKWK